MDEAGTGTWWVHIRPSVAVDGSMNREQFLQRTPALGQGSLGMMQPWTLFDAAKADFSLKIVTHAAAFLRVRGSVLIEHGLVGTTPYAGPPRAPGLLAVDFASVVGAFTTCSEILRKRLLAQGTEAAAATAADGDVLVGPVSRHLSSIVENLSCVIHDLVVTLSSAELRGLAAHVDSYLAEAAASPAHSFAAQVYQVLQEKVARNRTR